MANFDFLKPQQNYALFAPSAIEAERLFPASPAMCAVACRKALELAVKWVYAADSSMEMPYRNNLQSLLHEPTFRFALDNQTWGKLPFIVKLGNLAVHTERSVSPADALLSLRGLFEFIQWIDYCYGDAYEERGFDENEIPRAAAKAGESILRAKDAEIEALRKKIEEMSAAFTQAKEEHRQTRSFVPADCSEFETRRRFIDVDLKLLGWKFDGADADVQMEYEVEGMAGVPGQKGRADYVLFGRDGLPLAVIEAKRAGKDPNSGRTQAALYADCLERKFGRRPMMFTSNGFETYFWDDLSGPQRKVSGPFSKDDLQKLMDRREGRKDLLALPISDKITDRYYQKAAIRAVCGKIMEGFRRHLLVMATGTGKTRTASSLTDVLSRGGHITNVLFLADRTALVKQAKDDFKNYLPDMSLCNLCTNKDDKAARIVFSTYPTMLNAIDDTRTGEGRQLFTPAHFDLIIVDESHRSIFKKYRAIFEYFDAILVGLTATPKTDVDRNTYDFFEMENGIPTYAYDYETAVEVDKVLVPYYNYEVETKFLEKGIVYDELSEEDKRRYEEDFTEDDSIPEFIPSAALNRFVFNMDTVDTVLQDLMDRGIKVAGGDRIGKTIIFAQNKKHAELIVQRFNALYPMYKGGFAQRITCEDTYAQTIIEKFKMPEQEPHIAVSVDMMDTGIDVPECVNLVFFKKVRSKTKFWQMLGRGTRLAPNLSCIDQIDGEYTGKKRFLIFDYCGNFEFFREKPNGYESREVKTLSENIFGKQVRLAAALQESAFAEERFQSLRETLLNTCHEQIQVLNPERIAVKLRLQYVQKYKERSAFDVLSEGDKGELIREIAPLVTLADTDEAAKRFDNLIYGMMLSQLEAAPSFKRMKNQLCDTAAMLEKKAAIPQVKAKLPLIREINTDAFWDAKDILLFENARKELRELIKFLVEEGTPKPPVYTSLTDPVIGTREGEGLDAAYDFEDYRKRINRYVEENGNTLAIHKLTHNIPLASGDYEELERILTSELGSRTDYQREFGEKPFGLLIREVARLDHDAAMQAFSAFINDTSLNEAQIAFVLKIINHVEKNGYMKDVAELQKPPFDRPVNFIKLFDQKTRARLIQTIDSIRENAVKIM